MPEKKVVDGKEDQVKHVGGESVAVTAGEEDLEGEWSLLHPQPSLVRLARVQGAGRGVLATRWVQAHRRSSKCTFKEDKPRGGDSSGPSNRHR